MKSVESRSQYSKPEPSQNLLSTLQQCILPKANARATNEEDKAALQEEEDHVNGEMEDAMNEDDLRDSDAIETDDVNISESEIATNQKAGYNLKCLTGVWKMGTEIIVEDDIKEARVNA